MRKYLLSTSTLAGAALLSSAAVADVSITGSVEFDYMQSDSNIAGLDGTTNGSANEVHINFTNKTDSGLTLTYMNQIKTSSSAIDDNALTIEGGFGKVVMGGTNGAGTAYEMAASDLLAEETNSGLIATGTAGAVTGNISTNTGNGLDGNGQKISYHIPAMGGLTAGVSAEAATISGEDDKTHFGVKYAMDMDGTAVTIGYSASSQETAAAIADDNDATSMGVKVVTNGISVMVTGGTATGTGEDVSTQAAGLSYTLENGLTVGVATVKSEDDKDTGEEYTATHYEASYTIASGLTAVLNVSDTDYKKGTVNNTNKHDINGTNTSLTIKASF
jgi:hypothetical protein